MIEIFFIHHCKVIVKSNSADKHKQGSLGYLMPESHTDTPITDTVLAKKHQCVFFRGVKVRGLFI